MPIIKSAGMLHFGSELRGRLKPKQIVVAAMRKLLVLCFGVLKRANPSIPQ